MENQAAIKPNIDRSFLRWWVLANIVALPALLAPYKLGMFLAMGVAVAADGASVSSVVYIIGFLILLLCGALIGGWFGFLQWLVLRKYMSQAGKWVAASSIGLAIGTPLGWLAYGLLFISPIVNRPEGVYFSFWYQYITFGVLLGLSIGVAQWFVLKQQVPAAKLWIVALPILFTIGMAVANLSTVSDSYILSIHRMIQIMTNPPPDTQISDMQIFVFFGVIPNLIALIGTSLISGIFLNRLLQFRQKENVEQ
jgi:formate/nitrite transporter FocA (FNT family)